MVREVQNMYVTTHFLYFCAHTSTAGTKKVTDSKTNRNRYAIVPERGAVRTRERMDRKSVSITCRVFAEAYTFAINGS